MNHARFLKHSLICVVATCLYASLPPGPAAAAARDAYPSKPVRLVVPATAGGGIDLFARLIASKLQQVWDHAIVVDNRPGGGQTIGTELVARAAPDGHTLLVGANAHAVLPSLYRKLSFDPVRDFAPITLLGTSPNVLVTHPSLPTRTLKEFIALAKSKPGQINYGSSGNGGTGHLAMERLKSMAHIDLVHVPYKTNAPLLTALMSGEIAAGMGQIVVIAPQVRAGRLRALGVSSSRRSPALPDAPTIAESGIAGFEAVAWFGVLAPAHTPSHIIDKLNAEIVRIMKLPDVSARLTAEGVDVVGSTTEQFATLIKSDVDKWGKAIRALGIVLD